MIYQSKKCKKIKFYLELDKYNNPKKKYFHIKIKNKL